MLAARALLDHIPRGATDCAPIEDEFARLQAGWRGEQNLAYYLDTITDPAARIFYDLRQTALDHIFQMDTLLLNGTFALIMEVKNYAGTLLFEPSGRQMIRTLGDRRSGFSNPLVQVARHRKMLTAWLADHRLPSIPIESLVVFANPSTIIDNPGKLSEVIEKIIYAEQAISKIDQLKTKYAKSPRIVKAVPYIEQLLLREHTDPPLDLLKKHNVNPADLQRGVRCSNCHRFAMERVYANWICRRCGHGSKTAHIQMILDYFLLCGSTMTNKQCRDWLGVEDRQLIRYLLNQMKLVPVGSGNGSGLYYERPPHKWIDQFYREHTTQ